jgi:hypothetical protein
MSIANWSGKESTVFQVSGPTWGQREDYSTAVYIKIANGVTQASSKLSLLSKIYMVSRNTYKYFTFARNKSTAFPAPIFM